MLCWQVIEFKHGMSVSKRLGNTRRTGTASDVYWLSGLPLSQSEPAKNNWFLRGECEGRAEVVCKSGARMTMRQTRGGCQGVVVCNTPVMAATKLPLWLHAPAKHLAVI